MRIAPFAALLLLAPLAAAQQVTLRGKVENGPGAGQFFVDSTRTALTSSAVNLNAFDGQHVLIRGTWNGSATSPSVDVSAIAPTAEIFEIPGNPEVGDTVRFGATAAPGTRVSFFGALGAGFRPVRSSGVFFLDSQTSMKVATRTIGGAGNIEISIGMPNQAALIGREFYGQAVLVSNGQVVVSNPDSKTIR